MLKHVIRSIWTNIEVIFIRQIYDFSMLLSLFKNDQEWQSEDDSKVIINCFFLNIYQLFVNITKQFTTKFF